MHAFTHACKYQVLIYASHAYACCTNADTYIHTYIYVLYSNAHSYAHKAYLKADPYACTHTDTQHACVTNVLKRMRIHGGKYTILERNGI